LCGHALHLGRRSAGELRALNDIYPTQRLQGAPPPGPAQGAALAGMAAGGAAAGGAGQWDIPFRVVRQDQSLWCWAAVSSSVADYLGSPQWSQCLVASAEMGGN